MPLPQAVPLGTGALGPRATRPLCALPLEGVGVDPRDAHGARGGPTLVSPTSKSIMGSASRCPSTRTIRWTDFAKSMACWVKVEVVVTGSGCGDLLRRRHHTSPASANIDRLHALD